MGGSMTSTALSVLTWNINRRSADSLDAVESLPAPAPAVLTLQEVTRDQEPAIRKRLEGLGYATEYARRPHAKKDYGSLVAVHDSLTTLEPLDPADFGFPYSELVAHVKLDTDGGPVNVITAHIPNGSGMGWEKVDTLEALKWMVLTLKGEPIILTGDFNEPQWDMQDGKIVTWGQDPDTHGHYDCWDFWKFEGRTGPGIRWDTAVRWFFESTDESGLRNAFWEAKGKHKPEVSHRSRGNDRWFDHIFISEHLRVDSCEYQHAFRTDEYSDHSALLASLSLTPENMKSKEAE